MPKYVVTVRKKNGSHKRITVKAPDPGRAKGAALNHFSPGELATPGIIDVAREDRSRA